MKILFSSDHHLRNDRPICRTDTDWLQTQINQLKFIREQAVKKNCIILLGGDLFDTPTVPDIIKNIFINYLWNNGSQVIYAIAGQHSLPYHAEEYLDSSSFGVLLNGNIIHTPDQFGKYSHFNNKLRGEKTGLYFLHRMVFPTKRDMPPNTKAVTAAELLEEYSDARWILCGDIHRSFHIEYEGRHVIMAGCMNRQTYDLRDYQPVCWFIDTDKEIVEKIDIPDNVEIIENSSAKSREDRSSMRSAFLEVVKNSKSVSFDYKHNAENEMELNKDLTKSQKNIITEYLNG